MTNVLEPTNRLRHVWKVRVRGELLPLGHKMARNTDERVLALQQWYVSKSDQRDGQWMDVQIESEESKT